MFSHPAACTLTEDSEVCGMKLCDLLLCIQHGLDCACFLSEAVNLLGITQYEDWLNPGKMGARVYKMLRDEGEEHGEAKQTVSEVIPAYSRAFFWVLCTKRVETAFERKIPGISMP